MSQDPTNRELIEACALAQTRYDAMIGRVSKELGLLVDLVGEALAGREDLRKVRSGLRDFVSFVDELYKGAEPPSATPRPEPATKSPAKVARPKSRPTTKPAPAPDPDRYPLTAVQVAKACGVNLPVVAQARKALDLPHTGTGSNIRYAFAAIQLVKDFIAAGRERRARRKTKKAAERRAKSGEGKSETITDEEITAYLVEKVGYGQTITVPDLRRALGNPSPAKIKGWERRNPGLFRVVQEGSRGSTNPRVLYLVAPTEDENPFPMPPKITPGPDPYGSGFGQGATS